MAKHRSGRSSDVFSRPGPRPAGTHQKPAPQVVERKEPGGDWEHVARVADDNRDAWQHMAEATLRSGVQYRIRELADA